MPGTLKINEPVTFGKAGRIKDFDPYGFDLSEPSMSWTQEETARLTVMIAGLPPEPTLRLGIDATPFIHSNRVLQQQFFVFVNGLYVGFRTLAGPEQFNFPLPRTAISPRGVRFEFVIPTAVSPKSLGISDDIRKLGISLSQMTILSS